MFKVLDSLKAFLGVGVSHRVHVLEYSIWEAVSWWVMSCPPCEQVPEWVTVPWWGTTSSVLVWQGTWLLRRTRKPWAGCCSSTEPWAGRGRQVSDNRRALQRRRLWDVSSLQFQRSTWLYTWGLCSSLSSAWFILIPDIPADIGSLFLNAVQLLCKLFIPLFVIFGDFLRFLGFCLSKPLLLLFNNVT